ncbi:hypothetical protein PsorP6_003677 [Peronosclerospora sorghi]|uniref:Uncharacterized protein n=1 Tax=Peronosclerospora sorghi TaxID=230839 RepID=A0ACC0VK08_9STRA|nr:hypothetical protein PsorP6_003677 [Peronosclerospora sorghi]
MMKTQNADEELDKVHGQMTEERPLQNFRLPPSKLFVIPLRVTNPINDSLQHRDHNKFNNPWKPRFSTSGFALTGDIMARSSAVGRLCVRRSRPGSMIDNTTLLFPQHIACHISAAHGRKGIPISSRRGSTHPGSPGGRFYWQSERC